MKGGQVHQVPLTKRALEILREQHVATAGQGFVFPSVTGRGKPINVSTLNRFVPKPYTAWLQ